MSKHDDDTVLVQTQMAELPPGAVCTFLAFEYQRTDERGEKRTGTGVWTSPEANQANLDQRITFAERALKAIEVKLEALKAERTQQAGGVH